MMRGRPVEAELARLIELLPDLPGTVVLVSNEVGLGVVPTDAMARAFVDHAGWLHQRIAERADRRFSWRPACPFTSSRRRIA